MARQAVHSPTTRSSSVLRIGSVHVVCVSLRAKEETSIDSQRWPDYRGRQLQMGPSEFILATITKCCLMGGPVVHGSLQTIQATSATPKKPRIAAGVLIDCLTSLTNERHFLTKCAIFGRLSLLAFVLTPFTLLLTKSLGSWNSGKAPNVRIILFFSLALARTPPRVARRC
jgi:hypothetical protein